MNWRPMWKGAPWTPPTLEECLQSCLDNAAEAARDEIGYRDMYRRLQPGPECAETRTKISRAVNDHRHWSLMSQFYRDEIAKEPQPDRRLPREADDTDIPF